MPAKHFRKTGVLSQEEIDELLSAICPDDDKDFQPPPGAKKIKIYDFKYPDFLCKEEMNFMKDISSKLSDKITGYLNQEFNQNLTINLEKLETKTFEKFSEKLYNPHLCCSFAFQNQTCMFETSLELLFYELLEQEKHGKEKPSPAEFTVFQECVAKPVSRIIAETFDFYKDSENEEITDLNIYLNPRIYDCIFRDSFGLSLEYNVSRENQNEEFKIFIPKNLAVKVIEKEFRTDFIPLSHSDFNFYVELGNCYLPDNLELQPGTIIELNRKYGDYLNVYIDDEILGKGEIILIDDKYGVRMTDIAGVGYEYDENYKNQFLFNTQVIAATQYVSDTKDFGEGKIVEMTENYLSLYRVIKENKCIAYGEPLVLSGNVMGLKIVKL